MQFSINHEKDEDGFSNALGSSLIDVDLKSKGPKSDLSLTSSATADSLSSQEITQLPQIKLTFENISFEIKIKCSSQEEKITGQRYIRQKIVKDATGFALPGETLFIMGSSGAGKTSLLNIISDRISAKNGQRIKGKVLINDSIELNGSSFAKVACYVMQDDVLFQYFTPREALRFAARLKLPNASEEEQNSRVEVILDQLNLLHAADTRIGSIMTKTISGGERKRTAIGVELVTDPQLLLFDEPTSGLDSFQALSIVKLLNSLASQGKTIVSTIHQPSSEAFALFDRLILMCDGYVVYQGLAKQSSQYFKSIGYEVHTHTNPADFYMQILSITYPKLKTDIKKIKYIKRNYDALLGELTIAEPKKYKFPAPELSSRVLGKASYIQQQKYLIYRSWLQVKRDLKGLISSFLQMVIISLITVSIFWKMKKGDYAEIQSYCGCLFYCCSIQLYVGLLGNILQFIEERPLFLREQANRMYGVMPYFISKDVVNFPVQTITPLLFSFFYFGIGSDITFSQFLVFYYVQLMVGFATAAYGQIIGSVFDTSETACNFTPIVMLPFILFSGFFTNLDSYPKWIGWIQYFSPLRYGFEALIRNEFEDYEMPWFVPNPIEYLNFDIGFESCLVLIFVATYLAKVTACILLKFFIQKFQ